MHAIRTDNLQAVEIADLATPAVDAREAEQVKGGLNPQPLPPRWLIPIYNPPIFNPGPLLLR